MATKPDDTSVASWQTQQEILAEMGGEARVRLAIDMSESIRRIQIEGLLARNPDWDQARAVHEVVSRQFSVDLWRAV
jgi:hypothetical protein